jgi:kynurenine 3-monooxygenase
MEHKSKQEHILVIGAGLCGTMLAIRLAQRGYQVSLYESRGDMRTFQVDGGRSINLALSARGLMALDIIGLKEEVLKMCIPMHGRMIHNMDGSKRLSRYSGRQEDYINSVSRPGLNIALLNKAEEFRASPYVLQCEVHTGRPEQ